MQNKFVLSLAAGLLFFTGEAVVNAQPYSNAVAGLNPVGYWPLNETTQPPQPLNLTANNLGTLGAAGNGNYGAWYQPSGNTWFITNNTVLTTGATVDGDTAMNCQFAPGQYIVLPRNTNGVPNSALTLVPPFSIEAWVNPGATNARLGGIVSEGQVQLNSGGPNTNNPFYGGSGGTVWAGFALGQYQNYFFFSCYNTNAFNNKSSELDSPKTLIIGQWVHLVVTFDGTHEIMYENGVQVAQKTLVPNAAGLTYVPDPTSPLMIGSGSDVAVDYGVAWTGALDEVAIYNTLLPPSSMQNHYQTAFGTNATYGSNYTNAVLADSPMIYFRMDDAPAATNAGYASGTFPVANNYGSTGASGNGVYQPGTVPGLAGPSYSGFGANSKSVALNGWFGAVDVGSSNIPAALNPTGKAPLTVVTWFKTAPADAPGRFQEILGHSDSSYRLALGQVAGENHFNPGPSPAELQFTAASDLATNGFAFNDGQWHMVAGVSDGTNEYMYLDGTLAKSSNFPAGISITGTTRDLLLGGDPQYTAANANTPNTIRNFDGQIAQAAFWTNALSAGQIQSLFTAAGVPPYIWQEPVSVTTNAGVNLTVASGVRGSAPVSYQWYQNGSALSSQTSANLAYTPITTNNAGTYYLIASNSYGSITSSVVTLVVYGVPTILQQSPTQMEIFAGISPTLKATVAGEMPLSFQWSSNGVAIASGTTSAYTVANAQAGATYTCTITNVLGTNSINPISMSIVPAPTAPFPASVLADGPISYFRMDETSGTTCYDYVGGENGTYTNVSLGVPGYDSLNNVKTDSGETAAEFGDFPPNNDYAGNFPTYVNFGTPTGGNAEFSVEAWVTQYFYETNGDCIAGVGYGNGGEQFVLDTGNTGSGALRFFVRNAAGTVSAANATNLLSNDGKWHHVVGVCDEAGGHVYLYLDGAQVANAGITAGSGLQASSMPLSIGARESNNNNPVSYDAQFIGAIDDVAIYNKALSGTQIQSHYYATGFGPVITQLQPTNNLTTNQGSSVTFTVSVRGTAPLSYQWNDPHGNPLSGQTTATLTLANVQTNQSGNYTVTVTNLYGTAGTNTMLNVVIGAPLIVQDITPSNVTAYATDPVTLSVGVAGSQPLYYQWYQDGGAVFGATNSSFTFGALVGTNTYYCSITNSYSKGPTNSSIGTVVGVPITTLNPSNYTSNLKITFNGYNRGETLFDFPVLVRLSDSLPGFSYGQFASPAGGDLRFTDSTGTRELPYEIDEWNDTNGVSSVWVQVRQLSGTNDSIWAYWGNPSDVTPPAYTTNGSVWVPPSFEDLPSYDIVYHLKGTNFPYADSTQVYPALTGVAPAEAPGIVGSAEAFDGATTFLDSGVVSDLGSAFTLSAWVNVANTASSCQTIWANQKGGFGSAGFSFFVNFYQTANEQLLLDTGDGTNGKETSTAAGLVTFGQWHMVTAAIDATDRTVAFSVDGQPAGGGAVSNFTMVADLNLGRFTNSALYYTGLIDEARIHSGLDSSNWVWASYMTVASNSVFSTYSSVTSTAPPNVTLTIQYLNGAVVLTWPQGTLQSANQATGPYSNMPTATSPYTNVITGTQKFYRVKVQ